jgi:hypothetical protein
MTAVVTVVLGALAGGRVTSYWDAIKRRREIDLAAADEFYALYGEFYGTWVEWDAVRVGSFPQVDREQLRWSLYARSCAAQARVEALIARLATERILTDRDRALLGCFLQAYRTVSKSLEGNRAVGVHLVQPRENDPDDFDLWNSSEAVSYQTFKELMTAVCRIVSEEGRTPTKAHARESLRIITDNGFERPLWIGEARYQLGIVDSNDDPRMSGRAPVNTDAS